MIEADGSIVHEVRFEHPVERVWAAISERDALAQWLMPNDFEPRVGHRFHFDSRPGRGFIPVEVLELDPPRRLRMRWDLDDTPTFVTITLRPDGAATVLNLVHRALPNDPRPSFDAGWAEKLDALTATLRESS